MNSKTNVTKFTRAIIIICMVCSIIIVVRYSHVTRLAHTSSSLVRILHAPPKFSRRYGDFTANIIGTVSAGTKQIKYRLNDGSWLEAGQGRPRIPPPLFNVEMDAIKLQPGINHLEIEAAGYFRPPETISVDFEYDPTPIRLPIKVSWSEGSMLDVADGSWETFQVKGEWRIRTKPDYEGYDRMLIITGAFAGGRRVETDVIFRGNTEDDFGFGILPMWGGRPDEAGISLRRGWNFSLVWYWIRYRGVGNEFSYKYGDTPPKWVSSYYDLELKPGLRYFIIVESWPEIDESSQRLFYQQRMKWWAEDEPQPETWLDLSDREGAPLSPGEYGVALLAYHSQVDFGPVTVKPLGIADLDKTDLSLSSGE